MILLDVEQTGTAPYTKLSVLSSDSAANGTAAMSCRRSVPQPPQCRSCSRIVDSYALRENVKVTGSNVSKSGFSLSPV